MYIQWHITRYNDGRPLLKSKKTCGKKSEENYDDVIMGAIASQITSLTIVYSTVYSGADQRKHHSSAALAFVRGIHRGPVNSPHKGPVTRKMFPFDDVIMRMWGLKSQRSDWGNIASWQLFITSTPPRLSPKQVHWVQDLLQIFAQRFSFSKWTISAAKR